MKKLDKNSLDLVKENIEKLKEIFPDVFTENKIDFEKLRENLGEFVEESDEKYQFTWFGKRKANQLALTPTNATLRPAKSESKNWDTTKNIYIEGDNLEVLKVLQKAYYKKIKMIYIDPPYNTGKDFIYKDSYQDNLKNYLAMTGQIDEEGNPLTSNTEKSGRKHSNWLNMMYSRLKLARNLLKDDGVIFVSIDDNEVHNLRKIMDEIFGEENFIGLLSVENNPKGRKNSKFISISNDYCLVYAKNKEKSYFIENIPKDNMKIDEFGRHYTHGKRVIVGASSNKKVDNFNSEKHYSVYYNKKENQIILKQEKEINETDNNLISKGYKRYVSIKDNVFVENTYTKEKFKELFDMKSLIFKDDSIYEKDFNAFKRIKSLLKNENDIDVKTETAGNQLNELLGGKYFENPKNVNFLKLLISLFDEKEFIVLDFFSGSATTAHAVMELNAEDGGNRQFILVQLPEPTDEKSEAYKAGYKNICEIGKERIRRAGEKIKEDYKDKEWIDNLDIGFKVFKLDSTNIKEWDSNPDNLEKSLLDYGDFIKTGRSEEDLLYEILLKYGIDLTAPIEEKEINGKKVYIVGFSLIIYFDEIDIEIAKEIVNLVKKFESDFSVLVLKDDSFASSKDKVNIVEFFKQMNLFEKIITL